MAKPITLVKGKRLQSIIKKYDLGGGLSAMDGTQLQTAVNDGTMTAGSSGSGAPGPFGGIFGAATGILSSIIGGSLANKAQNALNLKTTNMLSPLKSALNVEGEQARNFGYPYQGTGVVNYYSAKGGYIPRMGDGGQVGGLYDTNKTAYVDSVLEANKNLEWVKRLRDKNSQSIQLKDEPYPSTHLMSDDGNGYVFPRLQTINGKLTDLGDKAEDYSRENNTGIQLPKEQGSWFAANGYKQGTNVLKNFGNKDPDDFAVGGKIAKYALGNNPAATTTAGGALIPVASDIAVAQGDTHQQDTNNDGRKGITLFKGGKAQAEIEDKEVVDSQGRVHSNQILLPNGKTVAEDTASWAKAKGVAEDNKTPYDQYADGTADRNIEKSDIHMANNFNYQEAIKMAMGLVPAKAGYKSTQAIGVDNDNPSYDPNDPNNFQGLKNTGSPIPVKRMGGYVAIHKGKDKLMGTTQPDNDSAYGKGGRIQYMKVGGKIMKFGKGGNTNAVNWLANGIASDGSSAAEEDTVAYDPNGYGVSANGVSNSNSGGGDNTAWNPFPKGSYGTASSGLSGLGTLSGIGKGILPLVDNVANAFIQKKTPPTPFPTMERAAYMKTSVNDNAALNAIDQGVAGASNDINRNSSNSATANINRMAIHTAGINAKNNILIGQDEKNTALQNAAAMNSQNIDNANRGKIDAYNAQNFNRTMYLNQQTSKNIANGANDLMQMIKDNDQQGLDQTKLKMGLLQTQNPGIFSNLMGTDAFDKIIHADPSYGLQIAGMLQGDAKSKWLNYYKLQQAA